MLFAILERRVAKLAKDKGTLQVEGMTQHKRRKQATCSQRTSLVGLWAGVARRVIQKGQHGRNRVIEDHGRLEKRPTASPQVVPWQKGPSRNLDLLRLLVCR